MSGFDTSQPIADEKSLKDGGVDDAAAKTAATDGKGQTAEDPQADELGDATPGPR